MTDPLDVPKYRNAGHAAYVMVKEEGISSLYKGLGLTIIRQGTLLLKNKEQIKLRISLFIST